MAVAENSDLYVGDSTYGHRRRLSSILATAKPPHADRRRMTPRARRPSGEVADDLVQATGGSSRPLQVAIDDMKAGLIWAADPEARPSSHGKWQMRGRIAFRRAPLPHAFSER